MPDSPRSTRSKKPRTGDSAAPPAPSKTVDPKAEAAARELATEAARLLADDKCEDVMVLDVRALSQVSDFLVVGSGTSDRQIRGTADDVKKLAEQMGHPVFGHHVDDQATWFILDCVDVVVHIFEPNTRAHYDLEMLWGEAPRLDWARPEQKPLDRSRDRAGLGRNSAGKSKN